MWLIPSAFLFVHSRNVHEAIDFLYEHDSVEERVKQEEILAVKTEDIWANANIYTTHYTIILF